MFKKLGRQIEKEVKRDVEKVFDVKIKVLKNKNAVESEAVEATPIPEVSTTVAPPEVSTPNVTSEILTSETPKKVSRCEKIYKMKTEPKGKVFLVNNRDFDVDPLRPDADYTRYGSEFDDEKLRKLWTELKFQVVPFSNLSKSDFEENFQKFVADMKEDCCIIIVMSHGTKAGNDRLNVRIKMADNRFVELNWILSCLHSENAPHLVDVPKVVVLGCCRGNSYDMGYEKKSLSFNFIASEGDEIIQTDADRSGGLSDILLVFPGNPDLATIRHTAMGSFFFQELISVMTEFWKEEHFLTMINTVDINLKERLNSQSLPIQVVNHYNFGFSKYLYFFDKE